MQWLEWNENCKTLNVSCTCFNLCILTKLKENIKCFFRKDLTSFFYVTSYIWLSASLLVNCDVSRLELVKNMMQIMHNTFLSAITSCVLFKFGFNFLKTFCMSVFFFSFFFKVNFGVFLHNRVSTLGLRCARHKNHKKV